MPKSKEPMEMIALQVPRVWKEKLEAYCKVNGYNMSYAIRQAVEKFILEPKFTLVDVAKWLELNLIFTFTVLERNAHIYQMFKFLFKSLGQQELAQKVAEDEARLRTHLDLIGAELEKALKEEEMLEILKRSKALKEG